MRSRLALDWSGSRPAISSGQRRWRRGLSRHAAPGDRWTPRALSWAGMRAMGRKANAIGLASVFTIVVYRFDAVFLGIVKGDAALGAYSAAYRLLETVFFVAWAVRRAVFPVMSSASVSRLRTEFERALSLIAWLYLPFATLLLVEAPAVLNTLYGPPYTTLSASSLRWLALAPLFFGIAHLASYALLALERRARLLWISGIAALVNIVGNLILVPAFSGPGAAAATTGAFALSAILLVASLHGEVGFRRVWRGFIAPAAASIALGVVLFVLSTRTAFSVRLIPGLAIYFGCW